MDNYISLPLKYRPQSMDDVVGQKHIVKTLRNAVRLDRIGHAYLFIGPAGTGKTSFARIWSKEMNCASDNPPCNECRVCKDISEGKSLDVIELNAADKRKIEDIRDSLARLQYKPSSKYKILILDECFHKDTLVGTVNGLTPISDIHVGDTVYNMTGCGEVVRTFRTEVSLDRLALVKLSNGRETLTTLEHLFYVNGSGWTKVCDLKAGDELYADSHCMSVLQENVLCNVQKRNEEVLFPEMLSQFEIRESIIRRNKIEDFTVGKTTEENSERKGDNSCEFCSYAEEQSDVHSGYNRENVGCQEKEWHIRLERQKGRKWADNKTTECIVSSVEKNCSAGGNFGTSDKLGQTSAGLSDMLQSGSCISKVQACDRSGRCESFEHGNDEAGQEENKETEVVRVESVTLYKSGDRREYFARYLSSEEISCGYINLYDLEVDTHHSYYANGVLVHNCHMLTSEAWNAMLKDLEEPKEYVIFILCTTNPEKIPTTILSRCQTFQFNSIALSDVAERLMYICDVEGFQYEPEAINFIAEYAKGGMRDAISALEQVALCSDDDITVDVVVDMLGLISKDVIDSFVDSIVAKDMDKCSELLNDIVSDNKDLNTLFDSLMERFRAVIRESLMGNGYKLNKLECFRISKTFLEHDKNMRYSCDNYFVLLSLFDALINGSGSNLDGRIAKLEEAVKNGSLTSSVVQKSAFAANIKAKLDKNADTPSQGEEITDSLVGFISSKTGGKVVK